MKKIIPALALLLISAMVLASASYAWFSMNTQVTATNMQVKAVSSSSLVIAQSKPVGTLRTTEYGTSASTLIPVTRDTTVGATTNLKYNTNPQNVDAHSGKKAASESELTFEDAINVTGKTYYVDYICYIASAGEALTGQKLETYLFTSAGINTNTQKAVSVDFYYSDESLADSAYDATDKTKIGTYAGTLNLSDLSKDATSGDFVSGTIDITVGQIPANNSTADFLRITMRIYFDGALEGDRYELTKDTELGSKTYYTWNSGTGTFVEVESPQVGSISTYYEKQTAGTFVYTDSASTTEIAFGVSFTAKTA